MAKAPTSTPAKPKASATLKSAAKKPATKKAIVNPDASEGEAKAKFAKALDEARAGAQALAGQAQGKAKAIASQAQEKAGAARTRAVEQGEALLEDAKVYGSQAKEKAADLAREGKIKASEAISGLGQIVAETAPTIYEKLGEKYGDYARTAARTIQEGAAKLEAKDLGELGNDAKELVKKSPGVAVGLAAVAGFFLARLFKGKGASSED